MMMFLLNMLCFLIGYLVASGIAAEAHNATMRKINKELTKATEEIKDMRNG